MRTSKRCAIAILLLVAWMPQPVRAQDAPPQDQSLGDLAKKSRAEKESKPHATAKKTLTDDDENLSGRPVRVRYQAGGQWAFVIYLPVTNGGSQGLTYFAYSVSLSASKMYIVVSRGIQGDDLRLAEETSITDLLNGAGLPSSLVTVEAWRGTKVGGQPAAASRFKFVSRGILHKGVNMLVRVNEQIMSVGCLYRQVDTEKASPICDDLIGSADVDRPADALPGARSPNDPSEAGDDDP